jgi:two-component system chemotaxis response regulator CheB
LKSTCFEVCKKGRCELKLRIVIAFPDDERPDHIVNSIRTASDFVITSQPRDLMNTYNEVESSPPNIVLISDRLAILPEFEVMRGLFSMMDVRWLVFQGDRSRFTPRQISGLPTGADLFTIPKSARPDAVLRQLRSLTRRPQRVTKSERSCDSQGRSRTPFRAMVTQITEPRNCVQSDGKIVLIGASTGGVDALMTVLSKFDQYCPPTLIVQHTGERFGSSLANLLDRNCPAKVHLASTPRGVGPGEVVIAAGLSSHMIIKQFAPLRIDFDLSGPVSGHQPSVDVLFRSATKYADRVVAALLTGMGRDGAAGLKALRNAGASTVVQDEATSVVYGMPRAAAEIGAAEKVLPVQKIGEMLICESKKRRNRSQEKQA